MTLESADVSTAHNSPTSRPFLAITAAAIEDPEGVVALSAQDYLGPFGYWLVIIAGEPWRRLGDDLEQQVATRGLGQRVRLDLGWIPEERMATLLAAADVLVLPYRRGTQSAVAPMALQQGVPVLSTAVGGVPEVVRDGVNGVVVPAGDPAAIARALETLDRERLRRLADGARRSVDELTWSGYATALDEVLTELMASTSFEPGADRR